MTQQTMPKIRSTYMIEEEIVKAMRKMASDNRWSFTTVVEIALEKLLKENEYLDKNGRRTDKAMDAEAE